MNIQQIVSMFNNPQIKNLINSKNPQQTALSILKNSPNANTDMGKNVINMLESGNLIGIEQYGRNLMQSQGINPDYIINFLKNMPK